MMKTVLYLNLTPFTPYAALRADFGRQGCGLNPGREKCFAPTERE